MSERAQQTDQSLRESVLSEELKVMSVEQLEFRLQALEERLPALSLSEGTELASLYSFFRLRG